MIYKHIINTSLESNNVNDDDVIELQTFILFFLTLQIYRNIFYKTNYFTTLCCLIVKSLLFLKQNTRYDKPIASGNECFKKKPT